MCYPYLTTNLDSIPIARRYRGVAFRFPTDPHRCRVVGTNETRGESRDADKIHGEKTREERGGRKKEEREKERDDRAAEAICRDVRRLDGPESVPLGDAVSLLARSRYIPTGSAGMFDFVCEKGEKEGGTMA